MIKKPVIAFLFVFSLSGCAFLNNNKPLNEESLEILELKKSIAETNLRLDELNNKFLLLHEKVEANSLKAGHVSTEAAAPPEGLKVVKLAEEEKEIPAASGPEDLYNDGQDFFLAGRYDAARAAFAELAENYPSHDLADNALYWIGESFYVEQDYKRALSKFSEAAEKYPKANKAPDAMLKAAFSYFELNDKKSGVETLNKLINTYPDSEAASIAKKRLKKP
ncbi:MAG TPA: tol-pal system protein YbgF [Thermodesulfobacteriota bacterium]|nr:tol-pal system protein YbgF [Thermodesulfobacteriota bacterium]